MPGKFKVLAIICVGQFSVPRHVDGLLRVPCDHDVKEYVTENEEIIRPTSPQLQDPH